MLRAPLPVHAWPKRLPQALADLRGAQGLAVIGITTAPTASRAQARHAIRHALQNTLAAFLDQPLASIILLSSPGRPVQVQMQTPGPPVYVAISHMPGMSVAAIHARGAVGVDVMAVSTQSLPDWAVVARNYLGPTAAAALQNTPPDQRSMVFARAWTSNEARLKCLGLGLTEWTPDVVLRLHGCTTVPLALPAGSCGILALQPTATD